MSIKKIIKKVIFGFLIFLLVFGGYLFIGSPPPAEKITWGVNFSQKHTQNLGLDWKETYLALLDDLKVKNIKLITHWDLIEPDYNPPTTLPAEGWAPKDKYNFEDLDWQIENAEERGVKIILVIGMKTPRWPECHIPEWANNLSKEEQQKEVLELLEKIVLRYGGQSSVWAWQVENEPFFPFGECPWRDREFLKKEINLVKSLDQKQRQIIVTESGEWSPWVLAPRYGDLVGVTMYRKVWNSHLGIYFSYDFFRPVYYRRKALLVKKIFDKKVIVVELQAEPWGPVLLYDLPLAEQEKTMNLEQFKYNLEFAKKTGLDTFYLWGAEWWYWLKEKQNQPEIWQEAKKLFL